MYIDKILAGILWVSMLVFSCSSIGEQAIPALKSNIELDGELKEAIWTSAKKITLDIETSPGENVTAQFKTDAYLYQDGSYLYIGIQAHDTEISSLRASIRDRDDISDEDSVGIKIDTFNDQRRSYNFFVNPLGIQEDSISDDVLDRLDLSWNAIWYSAGKVNENGYSVEIKIPFNILRFPSGNNDQIWAIDLVRNAPKDYDYRFASNPVDRNINCTICQYQKYTGFDNLQVGTNLEITPYIAANQSESRNLPISNSWQSEDLDTEAGVDIRWALSENSILNATINPDFSQVESDSAQLAVNNRFALFFEEKRPFFLEGSDYFNTMLTIFYSRNIADPDAGIKYTSKSDNGSLGVLIARDNSTNIILPSSQGSRLAFLNEESNSAALRYAHDYSDSTLFGITMTHRDAGEYSNDLISFDGKHQLTDTDVIRYQLIHTETSNPLEFQDPIFGLGASESGNAYRLNYNHSDRDWSWFLSHNHLDKGFRADLGFLTRSGYRKTVVGAGRRWYGTEGDFFSKIQLRGDWDTSVQYDGQRLETETEMTLSLEGRAQSEIDFHFGKRDVFFDEQWFDQSFYDISLSFKATNDLRLGFEYSLEDDIDFVSATARAGEVTGVAAFVDWQATKHINLFFDYARQNFDIESQSYFDANVVNANLIYQFDEKSFLRFLLRYTSSDFTQGDNSKNMVRQLLYAYKFDAKSVLYIGYSDNSIENQLIDSLTENGRTLFTKFSYAFQM